MSEPLTLAARDFVDAARVPVRIVLISIAGLWLCYFLLATLRGWAIGFVGGIVWGVISILVLSAVGAGMSTNSGLLLTSFTVA